jgi:F0F1-type ATP synthase epsilon subunit
MTSVLQGSATEQSEEFKRLVAESAKTATKGKDPTMHIKVYSPFQIYFDDTAYSISAVNGTGPFDILPQHHNFITLLNPCEMVVRSPKKEQKIRISGGLMHVKSDEVTVFLDI